MVGEDGDLELPNVGRRLEPGLLRQELLVIPEGTECGRFAA